MKGVRPYHNLDLPSPHTSLPHYLSIITPPARLQTFTPSHLHTFTPSHTHTPPSLSLSLMLATQSSTPHQQWLKMTATSYNRSNQSCTFLPVQTTGTLSTWCCKCASSIEDHRFFVTEALLQAALSQAAGGSTVKDAQQEGTGTTTKLEITTSIQHRGKQKEKDSSKGEQQHLVQPQPAKSAIKSKRAQTAAAAAAAPALGNLEGDAGS